MKHNTTTKTVPAHATLNANTTNKKTEQKEVTTMNAMNTNNTMNHMELSRKAMTKAHELKRQLLKDFPNEKPLFSICLKEAWEIIRREAIVNSTDIIGTWKNRTFQENNRLVINLLKKVAKNEIKSAKDSESELWYNRYLQWYNNIAFDYHANTDIMQDLMQTAYLIVFETMNEKFIDETNAKRQEKGNPELTYMQFVYNACRKAVRRTWTQYKKSASAIRTVIDDEGNEQQVIDIVAANSLTCYFEGTEQAAINSVHWNNAISKLDETNQTIVRNLTNGVTQKAIASHLEMSQPAIHKRVKNIRESLVESGIGIEWKRKQEEKQAAKKARAN